VGELRAKVLRGCPVLRAPSGETATGSAWLALLEAHVQAMNAGGVPKLGSVWSHVSEQECSRAIEEAVRVFSASAMSLAASFPTNGEVLDDAIRDAEAAARGTFADIALGDANSRAEFEADLARELDESAARLRKENNDTAVRENEAWLKRRLAQDFEGKFRDYQQRFDQGTLDVNGANEAESVLVGKLRLLRTAYMQEAVGPEEAITEAVERVLVSRQEALRRDLDAWKRAAARKSKKGHVTGVSPKDVRLREKGARGQREDDEPESSGPKCCVVQ